MGRRPALTSWLVVLVLAASLLDLLGGGQLAAAQVDAEAPAEQVVPPSRRDRAPRAQPAEPSSGAVTDMLGAWAPGDPDDAHGSADPAEPAAGVPSDADDSDSPSDAGDAGDLGTPDDPGKPDEAVAGATAEVGLVPPVSRRIRSAPPCPVEQGAASFGADDRLVMTYYYYWYDQVSLDDPSLAQRPPAEPPIDWRSVEWHERQLLDMASAGVDVALAVYWGTGPEWSVVGLERMVEARERLLAAGLRPPAIGLFFDTNLYATILPDRPELADLTSQDGIAVLADEVGAFFDLVPACHRARIDGRPLVFFWRADTEDGDRFTFDDRTFASLNDLIGQRYGERLHFALEQSWLAAAREAGVELGAADLYRWGAALNGPRFLGRTVAVGPGYDDRRIEGRPGYTRDRGDGATYSRDLRLAVLSGTSWLLLETWNELWEGTAIAETQDSGRMYLGITARYTALFHQLAHERARDGWMDLGSGEGVYLRRLADAPVEAGTPSVREGRYGASPFPEDDGTGYFHFAVDPRLGTVRPRPLTVWVEYFDEGAGSFALEYDSLDPDPSGAYTPTEAVDFQDTGTWRVARFALPELSFLGRQYDGAGDFRLHDRPGPDGRLHVFGRVRVTAEPGVRPVVYGPESLVFVDPADVRSAALRWSDLGPVGDYRVQVLPFDDDPQTAPGLTEYGFTLDERRRCLGPSAQAASLQPGDWSDSLPPGRPADVLCGLGLGAGVKEGLYRWRVQAVSSGGQPLGEPSDWAFFVVTR